MPTSTFTISSKKLSSRHPTVQMKQIDSDVTLNNNIQEKAIAESIKDLDVAKLIYQQEKETKRIETENAPLQRQQELRAALNTKSAIAMLEELRATELAKAKVNAESEIAEAEGQSKAKERRAEASLYEAQKEADAIHAKAEAQSEGLKSFLAVGDPDMIKFFMAVDKKVFVDLAQKTADALQGLAPKINIWNTGAASDKQHPYSALSELFKTLPPMLDAVRTQTNIKMPEWLPSSSS
jgi:flotillin